MTDDTPAAAGSRAPRMTVVEERDDRATFCIAPTDEAFMLALLHAILDDAHGVAFHLVEFEENGSEACDEWIALRLGLLPLAESPHSRLIAHAACACAGPFCDACGVVAYVDKRNPEDGPAALPVTSDDVFVLGAAVSVVPTAAPATLAFLQPGRRLCAGLVACKGSGAEHAKYAAAVAPRYVRSATRDDAFLLSLGTTGATTPRRLLRSALVGLRARAETVRALASDAAARLAETSP